MANNIIIRLPWPPSKTSPNASSPGNWRKKSSASKSYKATCLKECVAQGIGKLDWPDNYIPVEITYHPPRNGRVDWDNLANRAKHGWDAIAEAIGVDDGRWWPVLSRRGEKVAGGAIIVLFCTSPPDGCTDIEWKGIINGGGG